MEFSLTMKQLIKIVFKLKAEVPQTIIDPSTNDELIKRAFFGLRQPAAIKEHNVIVDKLITVSFGTIQGLKERSLLL